MIYHIPKERSYHQKDRTSLEAVTGEEVRDYGWGGAESGRNSQILDNMLKEATGPVKAEPISRRL